MKRLCSALAIVAGSLLMNGCVTSGPEFDHDAALKAYLALARGYISEQMSADAVRPLEQALELDDHNAEAWMLLAEVHRINGDYKQAREAYEKAVKYGAGSSRIANNYGTFLFQQKEYAEALRYFAEAGSDTAYLNRSVAFQNAGLASLKLGDTSEAEQNFKRAIQLDPSLATSLYELAELSFQNSNYALAKSYYQRFLERAQQTPRSLWLGIRLARIFEDQSAEASYALQLRKLYPGSEELRLYQESLKYGRG